MWVGYLKGNFINYKQFVNSKGHKNIMELQDRVIKICKMSIQTGWYQWYSSIPFIFSSTPCTIRAWPTRWPLAHQMATKLTKALAESLPEKSGCSFLTNVLHPSIQAIKFGPYTRVYQSSWLGFWQALLISRGFQVACHTRPVGLMDYMIWVPNHLHWINFKSSCTSKTRALHFTKPRSFLPRWITEIWGGAPFLPSNNKDKSPGHLRFLWLCHSTMATLLNTWLGKLPQKSRCAHWWKFCTSHGEQKHMRKKMTLRGELVISQPQQGKQISMIGRCSSSAGCAWVSCGHCHCSSTNSKGMCTKFDVCQSQWLPRIGTWLRRNSPYVKIENPPDSC